MAQVALELQPCCGKRSGIGTYTYELARRLQSNEELTFCGNLFGKGELEGLPFPVRRFKVMPYGVYRRIWHIAPLSYSMMFPRADLSIFFNYIVPPKVFGKVMTTIHDLTYLRYPETMDKKNLKRIEQDIQKSVERSDHILVVSEFTKQEVVECLHVQPEQISVVYNAPSVSNTLLNWENVGTRYHITKPYLLYVGTIEPRKNIAQLLRAFEQLKREANIPHQMVLAGGMGWNTQHIQTAIANSPYQKDIVLTGYISGDEKNTLYANAAAFLFPSLYEGFGIPPLEAMYFGCPVVCAYAASLPEVVGEAGEFVNPLDEYSVAQGIWNVLFHEDRANTLRNLGYEQCKRFSWEDSANELKRLCREVLDIT